MIYVLASLHVKVARRDEFLGIFLGQNGVFAHSEYLPASAEFSKFAALEFFLD